MKKIFNFFLFLFVETCEFFSGKSYIKGPWLLLPPEVPGSANRYFYRQELMLSTTNDISPTIAVVGRCAVLEYNEYIGGKFFFRNFT